MMQSMTGFGRAVCERETKIINIEIKSLNSKQLDIYTRLPSLYREKDLELRNLVSQELTRGKVELTISYENTDVNSSSTINIPQVKQYHNQLRELSDEFGTNKELLLHTIMRLPDAMKTEKEEIDEEEWNEIRKKIAEALCNINDFRKQEGTALEEDILKRVRKITLLLNDIKPFEETRKKMLREKITSNMEELVDRNSIDANRFEQELIYYLEKFDITEEKVRLTNHCSFFEEVTKESPVIGKKLSFIAQEMGREINTIGSKANNSDIQRIVVAMKDELEKIKEQLMNVL